MNNLPKQVLNKNDKLTRKDLKQFITNQLRILSFSKSNEIVLSIPMVVHEVNKDNIKEILLEDFPCLLNKISNIQEISNTNANPVILVTLENY